MKSVLLTTNFLLTFLLSASPQSLNWLHYNAENSPLPSNTINSILAVNDGKWIGTDEGLAFFDGTDWTVYTEETSDLPDNHVRDIFEDNWGNTWIATDKGIVQINENGWEIFNESNSGLPLNLVRSVATDQEGNLWVGTWGAGIAKKIGTQWTVYNTSNSDLAYNGVFTVNVNYLGHVWVGTYNGGVCVFNGSHWQNYNTSNSPLPHNNVRSITFDSNQTVWLGTDDGLARKTTNGSWDVFTYQNIGYSFHLIFDGVQESSGKVYFGTDGGLLAFDQANFEVKTTFNSNLQSNNIRCIAQDSEDNLWLGSGNDGISIYSPQGTLGINNLENDASLLTIYPNPAANHITFSLDKSENENLNIDVRNSVGQTIVTQNKTHTSGQLHQLNLEQLTPGIYHLTVQSSNALSTKTFYKL